MNARRRRVKQVIYEDNEEYRGDDRTLGTTALIDCRLERNPSTLTANDLSERKTTNPINESVMETKHR